ncbi:hypothetical protein FKM82_024694 [Ascaphus truei]
MTGPGSFARRPPHAAAPWICGASRRPWYRRICQGGARDTGGDWGTPHALWQLRCPRRRGGCMRHVWRRGVVRVRMGRVLGTRGPKAHRRVRKGHKAQGCRAGEV